MKELHVCCGFLLRLGPHVMQKVGDPLTALGTLARGGVLLEMEKNGQPIGCRPLDRKDVVGWSFYDLRVLERKDVIAIGLTHDVLLLCVQHRCCEDESLELDAVILAGTAQRTEPDGIDRLEVDEFDTVLPVAKCKVTLRG